MNRDQPMSFGDWMITILITAIPVVNIIALIVWAASSSTNINKQNWARASIAWFLIGLAFYVVAILIFGGLAFLGNGSS